MPPKNILNVKASPGISSKILAFDKTPTESPKKFPPSPPSPDTESSLERFTMTTTSPSSSLKTPSSSLSTPPSYKSSNSTQSSPILPLETCRQIREIHNKQRICIRAFESREAEMLRTQAHSEELADNLEKSASRTTDEKYIEFNDRWMQWLQKDVQKLRMEFEDLRAREKQLGGE